LSLARRLHAGHLGIAPIALIKTKRLIVAYRGWPLIFIKIFSKFGRKIPYERLVKEAVLCKKAT